jgi:arylsulfatase A-like enzyme
MSERHGSKVLIFLFGLLMMHLCSDVKKKPNILFIVCDDLNTHVSTSGYPDIHTPNFEELARESVNFVNAYCQYPVCGPSRASFLHGLYPETTGVLNNKVDIRQTRPKTLSMPQFFKQKGYWTASTGKVFHSDRQEQGHAVWSESVRFDNDTLPIITKAQKEFEIEFGSITSKKNKNKWKAYAKEVSYALNSQDAPGRGQSELRDEQHKDGKNALQVIQWLKNKSYGEKPFFIAMGIHKPHVPFLAPNKYFDLYPKEKINYIPNRPNLWESIPEDAMTKRFAAFGFELGEENDILRREYIQAYHACISFIDTQIGHVMDQLKKEKLWDNTIVVLTSDHGYHVGDHFLWGKVSLFDIGTRVPFIIRTPHLAQKNSKSDTMVELIDIFPTLADLAGYEIPSHIEGKSLKPVLLGDKKKYDGQYAYTVVSRGQQLGRAIRDQKWRYAKWPEGEELYNLEKDPREINNLSNSPEYQSILTEMRKVLEARLQH